MKKIINKYYNKQRKFSKPLNTELENYYEPYRIESLEIHEILEEIFNKHKNFTVGIIDNLEGGLAWDYTNVDDNERWRCIIGFTELGYWIYCNAPIKELK